MSREEIRGERERREKGGRRKRGIMRNEEERRQVTHDILYVMLCCVKLCCVVFSLLYSLPSILSTFRYVAYKVSTGSIVYNELYQSFQFCRMP